MKGCIGLSKMFRTNMKEKFVKGFVMAFVGLVSYPGLAIFNKLKVEGTEHIKNIPQKNVLFLSNHQTYFAEVIAILHIFCAVKWGKKNRLGVPYYLISPFTGAYFVSAATTMKKNIVHRIFALAGSIMVKRTWNNTSEIRSGLDPSDTRKILKVLHQSWVINFPQGTTQQFAQGRKGSAFLIKQNKPVVIPIVVDGFNVAFDKKGLRLKKRGTQLSIKFKPPLQIDYNDTTENIMRLVMSSIEQYQPACESVTP